MPCSRMDSWSLPGYLWISRSAIAEYSLSFNVSATTELYTLSLHDALPIFSGRPPTAWRRSSTTPSGRCRPSRRRSEEHTSELQSLRHLVCRLLLEKQKQLPLLDRQEPQCHYQVRRCSSHPNICVCLSRTVR